MFYSRKKICSSVRHHRNIFKTVDYKVKNVDKEFDDILLADVIDILDGNKDDNRVITNEISIKKGKFGDYIYYKTNKMSKPKFINLKKFEHNYKDCDKELIIQYVESNI